MAKKKKNKNRSKKRGEQQDFSSSLASQLQGIDVEVKSQPATSSPSPPRPPKREEPSVELTDEELFLKAMNEMPSPNMQRKRKGSSPFSSSLAGKLSDVDLSRERTPHAPREDHPMVPEDANGDEASVEDASDVSPEQTAGEEVAGPRAPLSQDELFEHALDAMAPTDVYVGKYHGAVPDLPPSVDDLSREGVQASAEHAQHSGEHTSKRAKGQPAEPLDEEEARHRIAELREDMLFERFVGKLDEVQDQSKYYRHQPRASSLEKPDGYSSQSPEDLIAPPLPKDGAGLNYVEELHSAHKGILNRCKLWMRHNDLPSLNLRGDSVEDALRQLELFIHQAWKDKARYARVIHGRGLQSEDGIPVLKPSVLHWLEGPGFRYVRGYAPELNAARDYGSIIVCLSKRGEE